MKKLLSIAALVLLAGCAAPASDYQPGRAQQILDRAQMTYVIVAVAAGTYSSLTPCTDTGPKVCKNAKVAAEIDKALAGVGAALDVAQKALDAGDNPSTYQKVKLALDTALAALKLAQSYGIG